MGQDYDVTLNTSPDPEDSTKKISHGMSYDGEKYVQPISISGAPTVDGRIPVDVGGATLDLRGATITVQTQNKFGCGATFADRPAATEVPVGFIFEAVNTHEFWQSNGTDWVVL